MRSCSVASPACGVWAGNTVQTAASSSTDNRTIGSPFRAFAWRFPWLSTSGDQLRVVPALNCRLATRKELRFPRMHRKKPGGSNYSRAQTNLLLI